MKLPLVYMIQNTAGHIKVGYSSVLNNRFGQVAPASPYPCELAATYCHPEARKIEQILHKILADVRLAGEWFDCSVDRIFNAIPMANAILAYRARPKPDKRLKLPKSGNVKPNREKPPFFDQVQDLLCLFTSDNDFVKSRARIDALCGIKRSAISNWKLYGIPNANRAVIYAHLKKSGTTPPEWLLDIDVPIGMNALDELVQAKKKQKQELTS